jgi:carbonic anhydrase/acetyltransferase-like protein (isoleucine patch superfamily)
MDDCVIGANCIIGALSFVPAKTIISDRKVVVGNPAKVVKEVSDKMIAWKTKGTALYQKLPFDCKETLKECEPLREVPSDRLKQKQVFKTWDNTK